MAGPGKGEPFVWTAAPGPIAAGDAARACSEALAVIAQAGATTWAGLAAALREDPGAVRAAMGCCVVPPSQQRLLDEHADLIGLLRVDPLVAVAVCPVCGRWSLWGVREPGMCQLTRGCTGRLVKAGRARKRTGPAEYEATFTPAPRP